MIEHSESGTMITGEDIGVYRVMVMRRGLILKIDTGMSLARISSLTAAQRAGITRCRTNRGALVDVNRWLVARGANEVWSKKYPHA